MVERFAVFSQFIDENVLSHAHDVKTTVLNILNGLLINGKQGKPVCFDVALTLSGKYAKQIIAHTLSPVSTDLKLKSSKPFP